MTSIFRRAEERKSKPMTDIVVSDAIRYVGVNDTTIDLFESQYLVPNGVSYTS